MSTEWTGKKILIVEDDEISFIFLEEILSETGAELLRASTGREAINQFKAHNDLDIILMDLQLPKLSGFDATRQIKNIKPGLPIIAQTAFAMQSDRKKAMEAGCNDYITKPIDHNMLIEVMKKYLH